MVDSAEDTHSRQFAGNPPRPRQPCWLRPWFLLALTLLLFSPVHEALSQDALPRITIAHQVIRYEGPLRAAPIAHLLKTAAGQAIRELVITSSGGEVAAAIVLGTWVYRRQLAVSVVGYCLSSCANYVFTAGRGRRVAPGAVVAWHGNYHHLLATGLWQDDIPLRMHRTGEDRAAARKHLWTQVQELVARERDFFALIGVDQDLCWVGKRPPYEVPNYFFLSAQDMARFGVRGVELPAGYTQTNVSELAVDIRFISLDQRSTEMGPEAEAEASGAAVEAASDSR